MEHVTMEHVSSCQFVLKYLLLCLLDFSNHRGLCFPNPCHNDGVCEEKGKKKYKCHCSKPFKGRKCEKGSQAISASMYFEAQTAGDLLKVTK